MIETARSLNWVYRRVTDFLVSFTIRYFVVWIGLWIVGLAVLWMSVSTELAAAAFGAGPFVLYYIYDEVVKRPLFVPVNGLQFEKYVKVDNPTDPEIVYPLINVYAEIENKGKVTAKECFFRYEFDSPETYKGRWGGGTDRETIDIHPGAVERALIMRIVPEEDSESIDEIKRAVNRSGATYEVAERFLPLTATHKRFDPIEVLGFQLHVQVPVSEDQELAYIAEQGMAPTERTDFIGQYIDPDQTFKPKLTFGAEDWKTTLAYDELTLEEILEEGMWETKDERFDSLRQALHWAGWESRF